MSLGLVRVGNSELLESIGLRGPQEGKELRHVERMGTIIALGHAGDIATSTAASSLSPPWPGSDSEAVPAGHVAHDERFEAFFACVGCHAATSSSADSIPRSIISASSGSANAFRVRLPRTAVLPLRAHRASRSPRRRTSRVRYSRKSLNFAFEAGYGGLNSDRSSALRMANVKYLSAPHPERWATVEMPNRLFL